MSTDNIYDPIQISNEFLSGQEISNQVSIEQGFNVEFFEVSKNLSFIKNFGNCLFIEWGLCFALGHAIIIWGG